MTDQEFLDAFFSGTLPNEQFHHRDHLRLTWLTLRRHGRGLGSRMLADGIRHFAAGHGQASRYQETMTQFWIRLVDHARRARPDVASFGEFVAAFPLVLDKTLPFRHWNRDTMMSPDARAAWLEPDLKSLGF